MRLVRKLENIPERWKWDTEEEGTKSHCGSGSWKMEHTIETWVMGGKDDGSWRWKLEVEDGGGRWEWKWKMAVEVENGSGRWQSNLKSDTGADKQKWN